MTALRRPEKDQMLMNWPERVWIYSPIRGLFQRREISRWLKLTGPSPGQDALEIGCGVGRGARLLVERMGFRRVIAFDLEDRLVRIAGWLLPIRLRNRVMFFTADAQDLPFRDNTFDAVVNFGIIHHVIDWRNCIREISRVMKPGGYFFFEEIYPPLYANFLLKRILRHPVEDRFYEKDFLGELARNGLGLLEGVKVGSRHGIVGAARKTA